MDRLFLGLSVIFFADGLGGKSIPQPPNLSSRVTLVSSEIRSFDTKEERIYFWIHESK